MIINYSFLSSVDQPTSFIKAVRKFLNTRITAPKKSPARFEPTPEAKVSNAKLLIKINFNLEKLIDFFLNSELACGSEFLPASIQKLLPQNRKT